MPFLAPCQALAQHLHQNLVFTQKGTPHQPPLTAKTNQTFHPSAPAQSSGIFSDSSFSDTSLKMYSESPLLTPALFGAAATASSLICYLNPLHFTLAAQPTQPPER